MTSGRNKTQEQTKREPVATDENGRQLMADAYEQYHAACDEIAKNGGWYTDSRGVERRRAALQLLDSAFARIKWLSVQYGFTPLAAKKLKAADEFTSEFADLIDEE